MNVLFVCVGNQGRSQMAHAFFERLVDGRHAVRSAGTRPGDAVHPEVAQAMAEVGLDVADRVPRRLDPQADAEWADVVVTMGCGDACPVLPGRRALDWDLEDPSGGPVERVRLIRDDVERRVRELVAELG